MARSSSRHPSVSGDNSVRPVGSVFLLRAAPDVAQQSNASMTVYATIVARKVGWLVRVCGLLSLFTFCPFVLQLEVPLLLSTPDTITYGMTAAVSVICELFPAVWVDVRQKYYSLKGWTSFFSRQSTTPTRYKPQANLFQICIETVVAFTNSKRSWVKKHNYRHHCYHHRHHY